QTLCLVGIPCHHYNGYTPIDPLYFFEDLYTRDSGQNYVAKNGMRPLFRQFLFQVGHALVYEDLEAELLKELLQDGQKAFLVIYYEQTFFRRHSWPGLYKNRPL